MNRQEEYRSFFAELEDGACLEGTLDRAHGRRKKAIRKGILRPAGCLAASFVIFVLLVNFCAPVAYACSQVPFLRELAEAVTFSKSLTDAVENAYVQPLELSQTENDITAEVAYLIVDQKQVNVFYRLKSELYSDLVADPNVFGADESRPASCSYTTNGYGVENGELCCLSIDFVDDNVPDSLKVKLDVYSTEVREEAFAPEKAVDNIFEDKPDDEPNYLAKFDFFLEFDPKFTASGKVIPVNQTVLLEGQAITITDIQIYPSHMRVNVADDPKNTAWLKRLDFYIETDWGMRFERGGGIIATGSGKTPFMESYRSDSAYFYDAKHLRLVITGAQWLRKDMERTYVNLVTGETGELPEGAAFDSARRTEDGWIVQFRADWEEDEPMHQHFQHQFYDAEGREYEITMWSNHYGEREESGKITCFYDEFPLKNYPYEEVWLCPQYSHSWVAEEEIVVPIQ